MKAIRQPTKIPTSDEGYLKVLKEKFGHESFKEGQLEANKNNLGA